jgi:hypothetical protein
MYCLLLMKVIMYPVINDTLLPTVTIEGPFASTPVINDTLLPTVTIDR